MNTVKKILAFILALLCGSAFAAGYVEVIDVSNDQFSLSGWACDNTCPNDATSVHVWRDDGVFLASMDASMTREGAVAQACKSNNSNHGFYFRTTFPKNLFDNKFHTVTIYSVGLSGNVETISSKILAFNLTTVPPITAVGNIEAMTLAGQLFRVSGWACDSTSPNEVTGIHVWRDDVYFAGGNAPITREWAVAQACNSNNSNHGFDITSTVPDNLLDGQTHPVTVYSVGPAGHVQAISSSNITFPPAISITVTRTPSPMVAEQSYTLKWSTTNATTLSYTCTASGTGYKGSSGALVLNGSSTGTALAAWVGYPSTCTWTATGANGLKKTYEETMTTQAATVPAPTITVTRTPSPMVAGQSYTLKWSTTNATSLSYTCTASGTGFTGSSGALAVNGSSSGTALAAWVGYSSTCTWTAAGAGGTKTYVETMTTQTATAAPPTITVTRTPSPMVAGQGYTLSWSTTNATSLSYTCTASGTGFTGNSGALAVNGSSSGTALAAWVGYPSACTWTATGAGGSKTYLETMTTQAALPPGGVTYIHNDIAGSPLAATDNSGKLLWKENYRPYGERVASASTATANNSLWFAGKPQDAQTGLSYMGARYYAPMLGRFVGVDPKEADPENLHSLNRYAYGNNNPYRYVDPDGRMSLAVTVTALGLGAAAWAVTPQDQREQMRRSFQQAQQRVSEMTDRFRNWMFNDAAEQSAPGTKDSDQGCIYCVEGDKTSSGRPYVGSTNDKNQREKDKTDGRDRTGAEVVDTYPKGSREERRQKEQQAINDRGGVDKLDNKRNEVRSSNWDRMGITPPPSNN